MTAWRWLTAVVLGCVTAGCLTSLASAYDPPASSMALLNNVDFASAVPLDERYRLEFVACDKGLAHIGRRDWFMSVDLRLPGRPEPKQFYLCSRDPSNVKALLKLKDGAILWHSKMALDVDGSWAAWNGIPGATDLKETSYKWSGVADQASRPAQLDPDRIPFVVIPTDGLRRLTGSRSGQLGRAFAEKTGLQLGDMGIVVYRDRWTPVLIGDSGPFMRLGEASSRVFEAIGQSRCKRWSSDGLTCTGPGNGAYPYRNFGLGKDVLFILFPGSRASELSPANALDKLCAFAKAKLGLTGGATCS